jgi:pilus assembly protein CpaF
MELIPAVLSEALNDQNITEILMNSESEIWFEQKGSLCKMNCSFESPIHYQNFIDSLCLEAKLIWSRENPSCEGQWRGFRVQLVCAPVTDQSFALSLRRLGGSHWSLHRLQGLGWMTSAQSQLLRESLLRRENILVIGPTGSGKTSVLSALLNEVPESQRVVVLEDTPELSSAGPQSIYMKTKKDFVADKADYDLERLIRLSLRMRPDRIVVGEVRGHEAKDLMLALSTGHEGSLGTLHASTPLQAITRLEMLVTMGAPQWPLSLVRKLIAQSLQLILVCQKKDGHRKFGGLFRITGYEESGLLLERVD